MVAPARPVASAEIETVWGQYVHDRIITIGHGAVAVSGAGDQVDLTSGLVWSLMEFTGTDLWDSQGMHSTVTNTGRINLAAPGLWAVYAKLAFASAVGQHLDYAGVSYGGGLGSAPLEKDWRSLQPVELVTNHHQFGPWYIVSAGGGGSQVELWAASDHSTGSEAVNATAGHGTFAAFLVGLNP